MTLRTVRAKITGQILTLDDALQDTVPAVLWPCSKPCRPTVRSCPWTPCSGAAAPWRR